MSGILGIFIYGRDNVRLFEAVNPRESSNLQELEMFVFCSLDIVDEKVAKTTEMYLGQLLSDQKYKSYAYVLNTGIRILLVTEFGGANLKDQDIRATFKRFHGYYCNTISNPFYNMGSRLQSKWLENGCKELFAENAE